MAPQNIIRSRTKKIFGLNVLTDEGLLLQYQQNLRLESHISAAADKVIDFLIIHREEFKDREFSQKALEVLSLSEKELKDFYVLVDRQTSTNLLNLQKLDRDKMVRLVSGGFTEKVAERLIKLEKLSTDTRLVVGMKKIVKPQSKTKKIPRIPSRQFEQQIGL